MNVVAPIFIEIISPTVIKQRVGKGNFYKTTPTISARSFLGAVCRHAIQENVQNSRGNCSNVTSVDTLPECANCQETENCLYWKLWHTGIVKINNFRCLGGKTDIDDDETWVVKFPLISGLQTLYKHRSRSTEYKDSLLLMYSLSKILESEKDLDNKNGFIESYIRFKENFNFQEYKRESANSCGLIDSEIKRINLDYVNLAHCAIDYNFGATRSGLLYFPQALSPGLIFQSKIFGPRDIIRKLEGEYSLGMGRSRGYGRVMVTIGKGDIRPIEEYKKMRIEEIKKGFEVIQQLLNIGEPLHYGTFTGLAPLPLDVVTDDVNKYEYDINDLIKKTINNRVNPQSNEMNVEFVKASIGDFTHLSSDGRGLKINPVIKSGYCGIFTIKEIDDDLIEKLVELEVPPKDMKTWFGWICFNHPIHYVQYSKINNKIK
ncbi:MAG: hypothetical protein ACTSRA_11650 [Promethearchaeota archaeon]